MTALRALSSALSAEQRAGPLAAIAARFPAVVLEALGRLAEGGVPHSTLYRVSLREWAYGGRWPSRMTAQPSSTAASIAPSRGSVAQPLQCSAFTP